MPTPDEYVLSMLEGAYFADDAEAVLPSGRKITGTEMRQLQAERKLYGQLADCWRCRCWGEYCGHND